jgi:hypothetical protein
MTDREIIQGLIDHDERMTQDFFFKKCRPLFTTIIQYVFDYEVEYDEFVNELYLYLMDNDAQKLRSFGFRSSVFQWLKTTAIRFFIKKRNRLIDNNSHELPSYDHPADGSSDKDAEDDLERLFSLMPNKRYVMVIRRLILDDVKPEILAKEMGTNTANLYNIRRRAIAQLARVCLMDIHYYDK